MISSSKKIALDQKVFILINTQIDQQTVRSQNKLTRIKNTPQTTKHSTRKCHIKKNLFNQQHKQNIPQGLQQMDSCLQMNEKQKTIKFTTQKSIFLQQKKQNYQLFFNSNNKHEQSDLHNCIATIMKQKEQIQNIRLINSNLELIMSKNEIKNKEDNIKWQKQRYELSSQLQKTKQENKIMRQKIIQLTQTFKQKLNNSKLYKLQKSQRLDYLNIKTQTNNKLIITSFIKQQQQQQQSNQQIQSYQHQYIQSYANQEQNHLVSRIQNKVQLLNQQLLYFIQLSSSLNTQIHTLQTNINSISQQLSTKSQQLQLKSIQLLQKISQLSQKQEQLSYSLQQVHTLKSNISNLEQNIRTQVHKFSQKQQLLMNQLNSYKNQYEVLKKRYFIMQGQFNKYSITLQENYNFKDKYQAVMLKYNCLYESYKSLYEEYINKSRQTDFVNELCQSDSRQLNSYQNLHQGSQFTKYSPKNYGKVLIHCAKQSLSDCSDITTPLEHSDSNQLNESYHPRIILKDLIKQTLNQM